MDRLRIAPLFMFFVGTLFVYGGFIDKSPAQIIRDALQPQPGEEDLYGPNVNPIYAGVTNAGVLRYQRPSPYTSIGVF